MIVNTEPPPSAILIGVQPSKQEGPFSITDSLLELGELARTAGVRVCTMLHQNREFPHPGLYLGKGKVAELKTLVEEHHAEVVIADDELTPSQQRNLETELGVKIMDRTGLILEIFSKRARTFESQLQVEMAQLEYLRPRLTRMWTHLSRLGGGIGTKGPGEKQLEVDKREIKKRVSTIKDKLEKIKMQRDTQRQRRHEVPLTAVAIIGYTNAGKSTLLNQMTQAGVLSEDLLFATLDPTTRRFNLPSNEHVLLTDTVGFIQKLPHQLVSSFRATLEEVVDADLLLHVVDVTHPNWQATVDTAQKLLVEMGAADIPQVMVFNKIDGLAHFDPAAPEFAQFPRRCFISARTGQRLESLIDIVDRFLAAQRKMMKFHIPYSRMDVVHMLHEYGLVKTVEYVDEIIVDVDINTIIGEKIMGAMYAPQKKE